MMKSLRPIAAPALATLAVLLLAGGWSTEWAHAQTRTLDHDDVVNWRSIQSASLSPDGRWVAYVLSALEGDPVLVVREAEEGGASLEVRGDSPRFTADSRFVVFSVPPIDAVVDSLRAEGTRQGDLPKDSLAFVEVSSIAGGAVAETVVSLGAVESFRVAGSGAWIAYVPVEDEDAEDEGEEEDDPAIEPAAAEAEEDEEEEDKEVGDRLILLDLASGSEASFDLVTEHVFAEEGETFVFATSSEDGSADGVYAVPLSVDDLSARPLIEGESHFRRIALSEDGSRAAFLADRDDFDADQPEFTLYHARGPDWAAAESGANARSTGIPDGWWVSEHGDVSFSESGERILFGTAPRPAPDPEDDTPEEDRVRVDVWNWKDPYLQPMQLVRADSERERTYRAVLHLADGQVTQLARTDLPSVSLGNDGHADHALGLNPLPYRQLVSWDGTYNDIHAVDVRTGESWPIAEMIKGSASLSPGHGFAYWWDGEELDWMVHDLTTGETSRAGESVPHPLWRELSDDPDIPPPYGSPGWTENDASFVFYDRFDVWAFDPTTKKSESLTDGAGRAAGIRFRYARTDFELDHIPSGHALWTAFDESDKRSGFFRGRTDRPTAPSQVIMSEHAYRLRGKADDAEHLLFTRENFREFPDLWVTDGGFTDAVRLSDANPQQTEFSWGDAKLVEWMSNDGVRLQGMLFTPDGFDPGQRYPMVVYFYERMSDGLHSYRSPRPGGSSISVSFYVSRGYVAFVPDIPYEIGYPGESALDAVVPGVLSLMAQGFVDEKRIGVQGHSWGGYQIAYMLTKTNLFAAAEAGAPVANMTSAYGGIRWGSGMSRMFQYERTQSRIGATLWDATQEYLHNSPLFFADKIRTPLLMMHNDNDGAVPWYQGIEMFVALRRLGKPVWMLNYNGEGHGLSRDPNRRDWSVRMQQFFDHYLMDAPAPVWMEDGVPAIMKGRTLGTDLVGRGGGDGS